MDKSRDVLVVVDMQNDFIDGDLGSAEAKSILDNVCKKIESWEGIVVFTMDTHGEDYLDTNEGKHIPVAHCIKNSYGWRLNDKVEATKGKLKSGYITVEKGTFGSKEVTDIVKNMHSNTVELVGLCTDICVISNAMILRSTLPEVNIIVDASCCAGVTPESHNIALAAMKMCCIEIKNTD